MKNFLLLVVALIFASVLIPLGIVFTVIQAVRQRSWRKVVGYLDKSAGALALAIDHFGNTVCRDLFNALFIQRGGYGFGNIRETISSVLGKNALGNKLTVAGWALVYLLDWIDKDHVLKAIKE